MMSGMPLKTCWAFNKFWNNKFYYKVASFWLFLLIHITMHESMNIKYKIYHLFQRTALLGPSHYLLPKRSLDLGCNLPLHVLCCLFRWRLLLNNFHIPKCDLHNALLLILVYVTSSCYVNVLCILYIYIYISSLLATLSLSFFVSSPTFMKMMG
jgi:hypothetical protein